MSEYNTTGGLKRVIHAFGYSLQGFRACYRHEAAFRQEVWVLLLAMPLGAWLGQTGVERVLLIGSWLVVLIAVSLLAGALWLVPRLGTEFVPELEEGTLNIRVTLAPSSSLDTALAVAAKLEPVLMGFPEVVYASSRVRRAELGGDPEPVSAKRPFPLTGSDMRSQTTTLVIRITEPASTRNARVRSHVWNRIERIVGRR